MTQTLHLTIAGLTCGHCVRALDSALRALPGVTLIHIDWQSGRAQATITGVTTVDGICAAVATTGFTVTEYRVTEAEPVDGASVRTMAIIGSGAAAMAAALHAAEAGIQVTLIERGHMGGTCVNVGCVPSKTLIRAAEALHRAQSTPFAGLAVQGRLTDPAALARQRQDLVDSLQQQKYVEVIDDHPAIRVLHGSARFADARSLRVNNTIVPFDRCLIATGSRPAFPDIPGLRDAHPLDSTAALALESLPQSLVILGGRIIALELAQAFARLGVQVTIIQRSERILPEVDTDAAEALTGYLRTEGITILTGTRIERVSGGPGATSVHLLSDEGAQVVSGERLLVALGRHANTEDLATNLAGIALAPDGSVLVDEHLRTGNPAVFAAGDVIGDPAFVYTAAYEGRVAATNALGGSITRDEAVLPWVLFTDPQIAIVGLGEDAARARGMHIAVSKLPLDQVPRALAARDTRGFLKLIKEADGDRLIGAVFLAPEAGDLIMEPTLAIRHGITVPQLIDTFHPYLTQIEGVRLTAQGFTRNPAKRSCCA